MTLSDGEGPYGLCHIVGCGVPGDECRLAVYDGEGDSSPMTILSTVLCRRPEPFCSDDVRALVGDPPPETSPNIAGALITAAMKRGEIRFLAFTRSTRGIGHSNRVGLYLGRD